MKARTAVIGVMAAAAMVIAGAGSASANIAWCTADPPARVVTADGARLSVNTYVTVARPEAHFLKDVQSIASTASDGKGGTLITVQVSLPAGISNAQITSRVRHYDIAASAAAAGGSVVILYLDVPKS